MTEQTEGAVPPPVNGIAALDLLIRCVPDNLNIAPELDQALGRVFEQVVGDAVGASDQTRAQTVVQKLNAIASLPKAGGLSQRAISALGKIGTDSANIAVCSDVVRALSGLFNKDGMEETAKNIQAPLIAIARAHPDEWRNSLGQIFDDAVGDRPRQFAGNVRQAIRQATWGLHEKRLIELAAQLG